MRKLPCHEARHVATVESKQGDRLYQANVDNSCSMAHASWLGTVAVLCRMASGTSALLSVKWATYEVHRQWLTCAA